MLGNRNGQAESFAFSCWARGIATVARSQAPPYKKGVRGSSGLSPMLLIACVFAFAPFLLLSKLLA